MSEIINKKSCLTLIVLGLLIVNFCSIRVSSSGDAEIIDLSIHIPTGEPITQFGNPVWIRGIWHYVNITLDSDVSKVSVVFYYGDSLPGLDDRDETNYYEWEYDHGSWRDVQHDSKYVEEGYCHHDADFYSFYIGIDQYAELGDWILRIFVGDEQLVSKQIYVDKAESSLVLRSTPVTIRVKPFTEDDFTSEEKFIVENKGNVPLRLSVSYGSYEDMFSTLDFNEVLKVDQIREYNILLHSKSSWKPGTMTIGDGEASVTGNVDYTIPPKKDVSLITSNISIALGINVYIGHGGYELEFLTGDITFQYAKNLEIYYGEVNDIFVYISGKGDVTVGITGENIDILNIFSGGVEIETPFTVRSTDTSECPIAVQVRGIGINTTAFLYYEIKTGGETQTFITQINIGPPRPPEEETTSSIMPIMVIIVIICIALVIGYIILAQIRGHRR